MRLGPLLVLLLSSHAGAEEMVRIAIADGRRAIALAGHGLEVRRLESGERYEPAAGGRSTVTLVRGRLLLDGAPVRAADGVKFRSRQFVQVAGEWVRGEIEVRVNGAGLIAIDVLPLEDYLLAVLGAEMPPGFPPEALKAQAVAARTYAVSRKIEAWGRPYHMGATVLSQVYGGAKAEDARTRRAVEATRGEVLVYHLEPIEAYFHSNCGGRTESGLAALGRNLPYLQPVSCPCGGPRASWRLQLGSEGFARLLSPVERFEVLERTGTGRVARALLAGPKGRRTVGGAELRRALGYDQLKSLDFKVEARGGRFSFSGKGFGHGAGMCQWGARGLAEQGWDYRRILAHYYAGTVLRRMY